MARSILLSDLIDEFEESLRSNSYSKNTIKNHVSSARHFLGHVGNIQSRSVTSRHVDRFFAERQTHGLKPGTLNVTLHGLRSLFVFAERRGYIAAGQNPAVHRRPYRDVPRERQRVPASEFGRLLDAAEHPQERIVVALGLYLFLRQSEIKALRVGDVDLHHGEVMVQVIKTKESDRMPISAELDAELRRWLTWYADHVDRPLKHTDRLAPAKARPVFVKGLSRADNLERARRVTLLDPTRPVSEPEHIVQRALARYGLPVRDDSGRSLFEGVHTLRRSGARALFDQLKDDGYDYAIRTVQAMLHHKSITTTEAYLGVTADKKKRDEILKGKMMFPTTHTNVVRMEKASGN